MHLSGFATTFATIIGTFILIAGWRNWDCVYIGKMALLEKIGGRPAARRFVMGSGSVIVVVCLLHLLGFV